MKRESIGIKEIDFMIEGGLPKGSIVGLSGPPGAGKSILSLHFLLEGARKGQKGLFISLEEPRTNIDKIIESFSFHKEFLEYEKQGLIVIKCFNYSEYEKINLDLLEKIKNSLDLKRVVIDSFNCFFDYLRGGLKEDSINVRRLINTSLTFLRKDDLNVLLILEKNENTFFNINYNIPYLVDGMISLDFLDLGTFERRIFIPKMRWTNQYKNSLLYEINSGGIFIINGI